MSKFRYVILCICVASMAIAQDGKILTLDAAQIKAKKANNKAWDIGFKKKNRLPDPYVAIFVQLDDQNPKKWFVQFRSKLIKDTLSPVWKEKVPITIEPGMKLKVDVYDKDLSKDDLIGSLVFTIPQGDNKQIVIEMGQVEKLVFKYAIVPKQAPINQEAPEPQAEEPDQTEEEFGDEYADDEYADDEYADDEYADDEYADENTY